MLESLITHTHLATTHSTNSQLIEWIGQNYSGRQSLFDYRKPQLVTADSQTQGRGQHGRTWQSPPGNVYLSFYIPNKQFCYDKTFALTQRLDGRLSLCVGYQLSQLSIINQLSQARQTQGLATLGVKWVNDIGLYQLVDSHYQFQKLAGILIEPVVAQGQLLGLVIGVGVNIALSPNLTAMTQQGLPYQAISLQALTHNTVNPAQDFYQPIQAALLKAIEQFNSFDKPEQVEQFIYDFDTVDVLKGKRLQIILPSPSAEIIGQAIGIDSHGCLQIHQDNGTITPIWTGTVQVLST